MPLVWAVRPSATSRAMIIRRLCLLAFLLCFCPTAARAQNAYVTNTLLDCATEVSANGTTLTTTILNNCTQGVHPTYSINTPANLTIESTPGINRLSTVYIRGTGAAIAASGTTRRFGYNPTVANSWVSVAPAYSTYALTKTACITFGINDAGGAGGPLDLLRIDDISGDWAVLQMWNGGGPGGTGYSYNLHSNPGGISATAGSTTIAQGSSHCFSLHYDGLGHTTSLYVYSTAGVQENHVTANTNSGCGSTANCAITSSRWGNVEAGTGTGLIYFWNIHDSSTDDDPLIPIANYWIPKWSAGGGAGAATSCTAVGVNIVAGDVVFLSAKWEGGAGGTVSASDGTSAFTMGPVVSFGSSADPRLVMGVLYTSIASGTPTYTIQIGASRTFRDCEVVALTPPPGRGTTVIDGDFVTGGSGTGTVFSDGGFTATGSEGVACSGYGEFGAVLGPIRSAGTTTPIAYIKASVGSSAIYCMHYTASGPYAVGTGVLSPSNQWDSFILVASSPAAGGSGGIGQMMLQRSGK